MPLPKTVFWLSQRELTDREREVIMELHGSGTAIYHVLPKHNDEWQLVDWCRENRGEFVYLPFDANIVGRGKQRGCKFGVLYYQYGRLQQINHFWTGQPPEIAWFDYSITPEVLAAVKRPVGLQPGDQLELF